MDACRAECERSWREMLAFRLKISQAPLRNTCEVDRDEKTSTFSEVFICLLTRDEIFGTQGTVLNNLDNNRKQESPISLYVPIVNTHFSDLLAARVLSS